MGLLPSCAVQVFSMSVHVVSERSLWRQARNDTLLGRSSKDEASSPGLRSPRARRIVHGRCAWSLPIHQHWHRISPLSVTHSIYTLFCTAPPPRLNTFLPHLQRSTCLRKCHGLPAPLVLGERHLVAAPLLRAPNAYAYRDKRYWTLEVGSPVIMAVRRYAYNAGRKLRPETPPRQENLRSILIKILTKSSVFFNNFAAKRVYLL